MAKTNSSDEIEIQKSITAISRDIINIQGFITQEIIKNIQANGGKVFSVGDPKFKEQINSLLNADPTSEANKGKAVLSFKATEIGIEEKLKSLEEKGAPKEEINKMREEFRIAKENFSKQLSSQEGLESLVGQRIASQLLLNSASFTVIDEKTKEERFLTMDEKKHFVDVMQKQVKLTPDMLDIMLDPGKTNEQAVIQNAVKERVVASFSNPNLKSQTSSLTIFEPSKLQDPTVLQNFSLEINSNYLKTKQIVIASSASLETYKDLGKTLIANVNANYKNGSIQTLQDSFKEGGDIHSISQALQERAQKLNDELKMLKENSTIIPEQINQEISSATLKELEAIASLQKNISNLSNSIGEATSNFDALKSVNEFSASINENREVKQGFLSTLFSAIYDGFIRKNPAELETSSEALRTIRETLGGEIVTAKTIIEKEQDQLVNVLKEVGMEKDHEMQSLTQESDITTKPPSSWKQKLTGEHKTQKETQEKPDPYKYSMAVTKDLAIINRRLSGIADDDEKGEAIGDFMKKRDKQESLEVLCNLVILGNKSLLKDFLEVESQGLIKDSAGKPIQHFTKENCQLVCDSVQKYIKDEGIKQGAEKTKIDACLKVLVKEKDITIDRGKGQEVNSR